MNYARKAQALRDLVGETIVESEIRCHRDKGCDGENLLVLTMESGKKYFIEGGYGGYTGNSCDEYYEKVTVDSEHSFL